MDDFKVKCSHHFAISQNYSPNCGVPFATPITRGAPGLAPVGSVIYQISPASPVS